jgi:hypothetical protein
MNTRTKQLKRESKINPPQMGIFQIRNTTNDRVFIGRTLNIEGILNRHRFALRQGNHSNRSLQSDWLEHGGENFAFEVLDVLAPSPDSSRDAENLICLEDLWLDKLQPYGQRGYNEPKKTREQRLAMIIEKRRE